MFKKRAQVCLFWLLVAGVAQAQWAGHWQGRLTQTGNPTGYSYTLTLEQNGDEVWGFATSTAEGGGPTARFEIGGLAEGDTLTLQEVKQLEPDPSLPRNRWCLKFIRLKLVQRPDSLVLQGSWEAPGCQPGRIELRRPAPNPGWIPAGKWTGYLSQSDRSYGFFFYLDLQPDGTGTSQIISDTEGGNATLSLRWRYDPDSMTLVFQEEKILDRSVPGWRWCIKSAKLRVDTSHLKVAASGPWQGEMKEAPLGPCAPGFLYVEKPLPPPAAEPDALAPPAPEYTRQSGRDIEVQRTLEVRSKNIRIRVWDNGIVDGDVLSLFLNGKLLVKNYRVTRQKMAIPVTLEQPVNYIILHAITTGSITPNTVAVSVDDGVEEQVVILSSNLDTSGAIMVRQFVVH